MKRFAPVLSGASRLYAALGFVSVLGMGLMSASVAQAAVTYLPPCFACTLDNAPPAGDEWVIQGVFVGVGSAGLSSPGALTNQAWYFSNAYTLDMFDRLSNRTRLYNSGTLRLLGGPLDNLGTFTNYGAVKVYAQLNNLAGARLNNGGQIDVRGTLNNSASLVNDGSVTLQSFAVLRNAAGATFDNRGSLTGQSSTMENLGTVRNRSGASMLSSGVSNGGQFINDAGGIVDTHNGFTNASGSQLVNHGTITVRDGDFVMAQGSNYDLTGGTLVVGGGQARLVLNRDLTVGVAQAGTVQLDNGSRLRNTAQWTVAQGYTQASGSHIDNQGQILVQGQLQSRGDVVNTGEILVQQGGQATFESDVLNQGHLGSTGGAMSFQQLVVGSGGWLSAQASTVEVAGGFINGSTQSALWNTSSAALHLTGQGTQTVALAGTDLGASRDGYVNNFAWSALDLGVNGQFVFTDGNEQTGGALYVGVVTLEGGLSQLASIDSAYNIYYDPTLAGNAYLGGASYAFGQGGGQLVAVAGLPSVQARAMAMSVQALPTAPVPEPSALLLAAGGACLAWRQRRRAALKRA